MHKFKKISIFAGILLLFFVFVVPVLADEYGLEATRTAAGLSSGSIPSIIGNMIGSVLSLVGVLFFALMLYGGVLWMLARGNQEQEKKALNTITGAIIGIIIIVASYAITNFVILGVQGKDSTSGASVDKCKAKHSTWSCQNIGTGCNIEGADTAAKRKNCTTENNCETNLCTGGDEMVCCLGSAADTGAGGEDPPSEESCKAISTGNLNKICQNLSSGVFPSDDCNTISPVSKELFEENAPMCSGEKGSCGYSGLDSDFCETLDIYDCPNAEEICETK